MVVPGFKARLRVSGTHHSRGRGQVLLAWGRSAPAFPHICWGRSAWPEGACFHVCPADIWAGVQGASGAGAQELGAGRALSVRGGHPLEVGTGLRVGKFPALAASGLCVEGRGLPYTCQGRVTIPSLFVYQTVSTEQLCEPSPVSAPGQGLVSRLSTGRQEPLGRAAKGTPEPSEQGWGSGRTRDLKDQGRENHFQPQSTDGVQREHTVFWKS